MAKKSRVLEAKRRKLGTTVKANYAFSVPVTVSQYKEFKKAVETLGDFALHLSDADLSRDHLDDATLQKALIQLLESESSYIGFAPESTNDVLGIQIGFSDYDLYETLSLSKAVDDLIELLPELWIDEEPEKHLIPYQKKLAAGLRKLADRVEAYDIYKDPNVVWNENQNQEVATSGN